MQSTPPPPTSRGKFSLQTTSHTTSAPRNNNLSQIENDITISEFTNSHAHFCATKAALASHLIIDDFESRNNVHCPEMTFFQNSLVVTHRAQNVSLAFTTAESILGTIYPTLESDDKSNDKNNGKNDEKRDDQNEPNSSPNPTTTTTTTTTHIAPPSNATLRSPQPSPQIPPPNPLPSHIILPEHPNIDSTHFIPKQVKVKDSTQWYRHMEEKSKVQVTEDCDTLGDWTYSTLYQGKMVNNDQNGGYFAPKLDLLPLTLHNTLSPDVGITSVVSPPPPFQYNDQKDLSPTASAIKSFQFDQHGPQTPQKDKEQQIITLCPFLTHLKSLKPPQNLLTPVLSSTGLTNLPKPELPELIPIDLKLWEQSPVGINYRLLGNTGEAIDFYNHVILFEDELHDNGTASFSIRIRVMKSCYYILVRNFVRVDDVVVRIRDTRYFYIFPTHDRLHLAPPQVPALSNHAPLSVLEHNFDNNENNNDYNRNNPTPDWLYRETKIQEATFEQLTQMGLSTEYKNYNEDYSWATLPTIFFLNERVDLNHVKQIG
jgi:hypothetical protein